MSVVQCAALLSGAGKTGGAGSRGMAVELNGMISSAVWRACFYARANCGSAGCAALLRTVSDRSKALPAADEAIPATQDRVGYRSRLQRASRKAPAYAVRSKRNTRRNYPGLFRCEAPKLRGSGCALHSPVRSLRIRLPRLRCQSPAICSARKRITAIRFGIECAIREFAAHRRSLRGRQQLRAVLQQAGGGEQAGLAVVVGL